MRDDPQIVSAIGDNSSYYQKNGEQTVKGLKLCEAYYHEVCEPMLRTKFSGQFNRIAAGLVGEGSECLGFDDELSQDHDFGPSIMLWLTDEDKTAFGQKLQKELDELPVDFCGFHGKNTSCWGKGRTGVLSIRQFYYKFTGLDRPPTALADWRRIPETNLSVATNGKLFFDPLGEFTAFRTALLSYYPEDVRLKKMAARCMKMAQAGQYNYPRCIERAEIVAAWMACAEFIDNAISMIFLLNRRYKPYYKWMHRSLGDLPVLGKQAQDTLRQMVAQKPEEKTVLIEALCAVIISELQQENLTSSHSDFLLDHGPEIQLRIQDPSLREMNPWLE